MPGPPSSPRHLSPPGLAIASAPLLPGMPQRLFAATPTRLLTWLRCRRRYRMTYLDRPAPPRGAPWAHSSLGAAVHTALARWWQEPLAGRTPSQAAELLAAAWTPAGFRNAAHSAHHQQQWSRRVAGYVAGLDPAVQPRGVERTVALTTPRLALSGRVDRIDERPSADGCTELTIVDYKTGRAAPSTADARGSLALAVYAAAAERTLRRPVGAVELHHLPSGRVISWRHEAAALARHLARADEIGAELAAAHPDRTGPAAAVSSAAAADREFPADPGPGCSWCDLRAHCPEGRRVSVDLPPWAGVEDDPR